MNVAVPPDTTPKVYTWAFWKVRCTESETISTDFFCAVTLKPITLSCTLNGSFAQAWVSHAWYWLFFFFCLINIPNIEAFHRTIFFKRLVFDVTTNVILNVVKYIGRIYQVCHGKYTFLQNLILVWNILSRTTNIIRCFPWPGNAHFIRFQSLSNSQTV